MSKKMMADIRENLCQELDEFARKKDFNTNDLEAIQKLTDSIKNIDKIFMLEDSSEYSNMGDWEMEGRGTYGHGNSYAKARDSRGRYTRPNYSFHSGYEETKEKVLDQLEELLQTTSREKEKDAICRCIEQLEKS